jgi:uncharacterized membrane protein YdbT with pleckstrin-like domain
MENHTYHRLGLFSFWMFALQNSVVAFTGLFLFFLSLALRIVGIGSLPAETEGATDTLLNFAVLGSFALLIAGAAVAFILAVIQYYSYRYTLGEHEMHIKRGILNTDEITIPYRHIIDIEIERPLIYQILGASILTIYSRADTNSGDHTYDASEGRLPVVRKGFAKQFREDLLKKAHEQDMGRS